MKTILVVDDEEDIRKVIQIRMEAKGFQVRTAQNGQEAIESVKQQRPDLVILDVMMPIMNGYTVCEKLKLEGEYKDLPILLLTARNQEIDQRISKMMGIDYMQKPYEAETLETKVNKLLQG